MRYQESLWCWEENYYDYVIIIIVVGDRWDKNITMGKKNLLEEVSLFWEGDLDNNNEIRSLGIYSH